MNPLVIYHRSDFDGIFCREVAHKFLPDAELLGWEYGDPVPEVSLERDLYILDLSIEGLMNHPRLTWIDHHASAIAKFPATVVGYRIDGVAACRLAWQWFIQDRHKTAHSIHDLPEKQVYVDRHVTEPLAVQLAGEYDVWDKRDPNAELFQHGLRSRVLGPDTWDILLSGPTQPEDGKQGLAELYVETLLDAGEALQYARCKEDASTITAFGFTINFEGLCLLACNVPKCNSLFFHAGLEPEHDGCFAFHWTGKHWRCSLYGVPGKPDVDLSTIAIKYGGGGHKQACGFTCQDLPFQLCP